MDNGKITLKDKKTGEVTKHFPVDVAEILSLNPGKFEIVDDGAIESGRMLAHGLRAAAEGEAVVTGIAPEIVKVAENPVPEEEAKPVEKPAAEAPKTEQPAKK